MRNGPSPSVPTGAIALARLVRIHPSQAQPILVCDFCHYADEGISGVLQVSAATFTHSLCCFSWPNFDIDWALFCCSRSDTIPGLMGGLPKGESEAGACRLGAHLDHEPFGLAAFSLGLGWPSTQTVRTL